MTNSDKKLIAEFMGCLFYHENECNPTHWKDINYDSDWNMLMPVYLKAKKTIKSKVIYGMIHNHGSQDVVAAGKLILDGDIVGATTKLIEAITWYNKNQF